MNVRATTRRTRECTGVTSSHTSTSTRAAALENSGSIATSPDSAPGEDLSNVFNPIPPIPPSSDDALATFAQLDIGN